MNKVCIIIGEGKTERSFYPSLIRNKFDFEPIEAKRPIIYKSRKNDSLYCVIAQPSLGVTHSGGINMLEDKGTYIKSDTIITNYKRILGNNPELSYVIITDTDGRKASELVNREKLINDAVCNSGIVYANKNILFAKREIESWFIAGLNYKFPHIGNLPNRSLDKLLSLNPEDIHDPKEELDKVLKDISGDRIKIGDEFGRYIL